MYSLTTPLLEYFVSRRDAQIIFRYGNEKLEIQATVHRRLDEVNIIVAAVIITNNQTLVISIPPHERKE